MLSGQVEGLELEGDGDKLFNALDGGGLRLEGNEWVGIPVVGHGGRGRRGGAAPQVRNGSAAVMVEGRGSF